MRSSQGTAKEQAVESQEQPCVRNRWTTSCPPVSLHVEFAQPTLTQLALSQTNRWLRTQKGTAFKWPSLQIRGVAHVELHLR